MKKVFPLAAALILTGSFASAELSQSLRDWPKGPAGFLLTKKEKKDYSKIKVDGEAQAFIDLFWAKRDPDLESAVNEFKVEFDRRVAYADANFGYGKVAGSMSDRGRTLVVMGPWAHRSALPPGETVQHIESEDQANELSEGGGAAEVWIYRQGQFPGSIKAEQVAFVFVQTRIGLDDYPLARADTRTVSAMKALAAMPDALLRHPDLKEVPRVGFIAGSKSATAADLALLAAEPKPWPDGTAVRTITGTQSPSLHPLWLFVRVPEGNAAATRVVGRVRGAEGAEAGTFVKAIQPLAAAGGNAYEFSLPVPPGKWHVDLALVGDSGPVAVSTIEAETEAVPADGTYISPFIWGLDVRQEVNARLGDPFNVGGWHALPNIGDLYSSKDSISYFCYVVRPGLGAAEAAATGAEAVAPQPKFELLVKVTLDGTVLGELPAQAVTISPVVDDLFMFGNSLPLAGFRKPGNYVLELSLRDTVSGVSRTVQIPIVIPAETAAKP